MKFIIFSESLSIQCFHWVLMRIQHHMDMMSCDKKQARLWSKRLHIAIQVKHIYTFDIIFLAYFNGKLQTFI